MRKLYTLLLLLLVAIHLQVTAQSAPAEANPGPRLPNNRSHSLIRYGFPIHIGAAFMVPSPTEGVPPGVGPGVSFRFGSALQIWPSRIIGPSFGLGFNLIHATARQDENFFQPEITANSRQFLFTLPVGFTLRSNPDKKVRFFFATHYENQFMLSSTTLVTLKSGNESISEVINDTEDYHTDGNFYFGAIRFNLGLDIQVVGKASLLVGPYIVVEDVVTPANIQGAESSDGRGPFTMAAGLNFGVMLDCRPGAR